MTVLLPHFGCRGDLPLVITKKNVIFFIIKNGAQIGVLYAPIFFPVFVPSEVSYLLSYRENLIIFRSKSRAPNLFFTPSWTPCFLLFCLAVSVLGLCGAQCYHLAKMVFVKAHRGGWRLFDRHRPCGCFGLFGFVYGRSTPKEVTEVSHSVAVSVA